MVNEAHMRADQAEAQLQAQGIRRGQRVEVTGGKYAGERGTVAAYYPRPQYASDKALVRLDGFSGAWEAETAPEHLKEIEETR